MFLLIKRHSDLIEEKKDLLLGSPSFIFKDLNRDLKYI